MKYLKKAFVVLMAAMMTFALVACGEQSFKEMFAEYDGKSFCEIGSDGSYIEFDTNPTDIDDYYDAEAVAAIQDACTKLGFSESVYKQMSATRALDGRQSASIEGYEASWSYHPDNGLEVVFTKTK